MKLKHLALAFTIAAWLWVGLAFGLGCVVKRNPRVYHIIER